MLLQRLHALKLWKKKHIWAYLGVVLALLVGCMVLCLRDRECISYQGETVFTSGEAVHRAVYEGISLKPGVYRIGLHYQTDKDYIGLCSAGMDTDNPRGLLTNGEHLYAGLGSTDYQLWLFEPTENLQILVSYDGEGNLSTGDLVIANTGQLWTMAAVIIVVLALLGLVIIVMVAYAKTYKISSETRMVLFFLAVITLLASWAQLRNSMLSGADLTYHLQRIEGVKDGLSTGQFPVRIAPKWLYGHGYADAVFYCNTLLYLPAFLRLAGFTVTISYNLFCMALNLATAVIAWYAFGKIFKDNRIGLMCSALYTMSFIRIYKLAIVGAVGEGSALTFLPLIFYGLYRVFTEDAKSENYKTAWIPVALGYTGVIQCHVLTCEITAFVTLVLCLVCIRKVFQKPVFMALLKGALGAVAFSLWYLVPFVDYFLTQNMHIRHVSGRTIQERGLYPAQLLVNSWSSEIEARLVAKGLTDVEAGCVCSLFVLALAVFVLLWIGRQLPKFETAVRRAAQFSAVLAVLLMVMSLRIFPWNSIQASSEVMASLVSSLQFPNRFLGWACVLLCMVFGACVACVGNCPGKGHNKGKIVYGVAALLTIISVGTGSFYMVKQALQEKASFTLHNEESMGCGYISGAEYLVEGTDEELLTFAGPVPGEGVEASDYAKSGLHATLNCVNERAEVSYVDLPILLYKGYHAYGEDGSELAVCDGANHLVRVMLPAGYEGEVQVRFESPWYWRLSELVTVIVLIGMVVGKGEKYVKRIKANR